MRLLVMLADMEIMTHSKTAGEVPHELQSSLHVGEPECRAEFSRNSFLRWSQVTGDVAVTGAT